MTAERHVHSISLATFSIWYLFLHHTSKCFLVWDCRQPISSWLYECCILLLYTSRLICTYIVVLQSLRLSNKDYLHVIFIRLLSFLKERSGLARSPCCMYLYLSVVLQLHEAVETSYEHYVTGGYTNVAICNFLQKACQTLNLWSGRNIDENLGFKTDGPRI
jgi:hypothetical protein